MELAFLEEAQKIWNKLKLKGSVRNRTFDFELKKRFLDFFQVGDSYYYILDVQHDKFVHMSDTVSRVLGYPKEQISISFLMSIVHPDDRFSFLNHSNTAIDFFKKLPKEKITKYKFNKDFRILHARGEYIRILQQVLILSYDNDNNALRVFGVHTDISHLKADNTPVMSFIGLDGEPSYINVAAKEVYKPSKEIFTKREKEVVRHLLAGKQTAAIAEAMFISKHTVNTHRKNILAKTKTKTTIEMTIKVISQGLI
jgi:DNA-binding CsgD family transcriptional regulator